MPINPLLSDTVDRQTRFFRRTPLRHNRIVSDQTDASISPAAAKFLFSSSVSIVLFELLRYEPNFSNGKTIPAVSLLSDAIRLSTLLKAEKLGAFEKTKIPSTSWVLKHVIQASMVLKLFGASSGPLSTATKMRGYNTPSLPLAEDFTSPSSTSRLKSR